ncbi:MAG: polysaccharide deacetylase family protein [Clostridiales bacterium]|nr:polysaccharide deacetylase family protein [Clostridiales bacterium]
MYLGSVRFFKHLILLVIVLIIVSLLIGLVSAHGRYNKLEKTTERYENALSAMGYVLPERNGSKETSKNSENEQAEPSPDQNDFFLPSFSYQTQYPDLYVSPPASRHESEGNTIYLTFDGGISSNTAAVLDVLREKDISATFFVVGSYAEGCEDILRRIVDEGHSLGMRSYSNNIDKIYSSVAEFLSDMERCFKFFKDETGASPLIFRFPGGSINSYNSGIFQQLIAETTRRGFVFFDWNVLAQDVYTYEDTSMTENVLDGCAYMEGGIVLFHDQYTDADELSALIDLLLRRGYSLEKLSPEVQPIVFSYPQPRRSQLK